MSESGNNGGSGQLTGTEKYELGFQRESWCAVEMKKEQDWCRATRKHNKDHFTSTVFCPGRVESEARCTFQVNKPTHLQRRHYTDQRKSNAHP